MRTGEDNWGPWAVGITPMERLARLRSLRTIAVCMFGVFCPVVKPLMLAESLEEADVTAALAALNALPSRDRRKITSSYGAVNLRPNRTAA